MDAMDRIGSTAQTLVYNSYQQIPSSFFLVSIAHPIVHRSPVYCV